ncbi:class I SAM-dependent methyltransferase [soil metagenome]
MQDREYDTLRQVEDTYWWYLALRKHVVTVLKHALVSRDTAVILDAGCGTGGMLQHLDQANPGWQLHGLDFSALALEHTRKRGFNNLIQGSVDAIPAPDASFDAIVSLDVLYHQAVDETKAVGEFLRILKPGGVLILNLPAFDFLAGSHDVAVEGARRYTENQLRKLLIKQGFEIEQLHYWNAWLFLPIMFWRIMTRFFSSNDKPASDLTHLPPIVNRALALLTKMDITLCRLLHLPFGTSVFAVARKKVS